MIVALNKTLSRRIMHFPGRAEMSEETLVHKTDIVLHGDTYQIMVFCRADGRHFAKTHFSEGDIIINDGSSLEEALAKHEKLLPLAISSRKVRHDFRGNPKRSKGARS
jgi:hypothetical protein